MAKSEHLSTQTSSSWVRILVVAGGALLGSSNFLLIGDGDGLEADSGDAAKEVYDFVFMVGEAVGVELFADGGVFGFILFVLIYNPFEGGAVADRESS